MISISIRFIGLCTHIAKSDVSCLPHERRVVMLANTARELGPHRLPVELHRPLLLIPGMPNRTLDGVTLCIRNEQVHGVPQIEALSWDAVTSLSQGNPDLELDTDIVCHGAKPAAAYFDFDSGRLTACRIAGGDAIGTSVELEIDDDVAMLEITQFDGSDPEPPIPLADLTTIMIVNVSANGKDSDNDYLINYLLFRNPPPDPPKPAASLLLPLLTVCTEVPVGIGNQPIDITPSCSNSHYP